MKQKIKGVNAERALTHAFWSVGWAAVRVAGSGSSRYPSCDIIAGNLKRQLAIECKSTKENKKYFSKEDLASLKSFAASFGAEPWIAVKFGSNPWWFLAPDDLAKTEKGFVISSNVIKRRGLGLSDLISN